MSTVHRASSFKPKVELCADPSIQSQTSPAGLNANIKYSITSMFPTTVSGELS